MEAAYFNVDLRDLDSLMEQREPFIQAGKFPHIPDL